MANSSVFGKVWDFIVDYCGRHKHPVNAILHIFGVPMVFYGIYQWFVGGIALGWALFIGGYILQWLGHNAQGNEVGEVILVKKIVSRLSGKKNESSQREIEQDKQEITG
jgi:hypothetical protein